MPVRRYAKATQTLIEAVDEKYGRQITGAQVENWKTRKFAPEIPPIPNRTVAYYSELATLIRRGRQGNIGALTVMAFRGFHDCIHEDMLLADMLASLRSRLDVETDDPDEDNRRARSIVTTTRTRDNPELALALRTLRQQPTTLLSQRPIDTSDSDDVKYSDMLDAPFDVVFAESIIRLIDGSKMGAGEELIGTIHASVGKELEPLTGSIPTSSLVNAAEELSSIRMNDLRRAVRFNTVPEIVDLAHILYPLMAMILPRLQGDQPIAVLELECMAGSIALQERLHSTAYRILKYLSGEIIKETGLLPHVPGYEEQSQ